MSKLSETEKNAMILFSGRLLGIFLSVIYVVVTPRILGPENYGYYSFWFSQIFILFTLLDLGTLDAIKRYLPSYMTNNTGIGRNLIFRMLSVKLIVLPFFLPMIFFYQTKYSFLAILTGAIFAAFSFSLSEVSFAGNYMLDYTLQQSLRKLVRFICVILLFLLLGTTGIIPSLILTEILALVIIFLWVKPYFPKGPVKPLDKPFVHYLNYGFIIFVSTFIFLSMGRLPVIIAKFKGLSLAEIGFLALSIDICYFAMRELFYSISESLLPMQTVQHTEGRSNILESSFGTAITLTTVIMIPCLIILHVYAEHTVLLFGKVYAPIVPIFRPFLPVVLFIVLGFIYRQILIIFEEKYKILTANIISITCFLILTLVPAQISSATFTRARLFSYFFSFFITRHFSRKCMKITKEYSNFFVLGLTGWGFYIILALAQKLSPLPQLVILPFNIAIYFIIIYIFKLIDPTVFKRVLSSLWFK